VQSRISRGMAQLQQLLMNSAKKNPSGLSKKEHHG
jgi:hypothetical protein